ncbi:MAG: diaminobutyrate acetyltransferase [Myxococcales bacterium]|nr:diaminobutyrate acetyltransferase [Myxococcales bacterium]
MTEEIEAATPRNRATDAPEYRIRAPRAEDGAAIWRLVQACGVLSVNSAYSYVLMADQFSATCALAECEGRPEGLVIGFRPPRHPDALFVWQIGVHPRARHSGLARRMLEAIFARPENRDLDQLLTTVTPGNRASEAMFRSFAAHRDAAMEMVGGYRADFFPDTPETERLFRIHWQKNPGDATC